MANDNIKRLSLYFNMDNPIEKEMWLYLEKSRKKSITIKLLLEKELGLSLFNTATETIKDEDNNKNHLKIDEIDPSGMNGF